jgi:hypothetical protein
VVIERKEHRIPVMLTTKALKEIDAWRRGQEDLPSRSAAIRRLVARGLKAGSRAVSRAEENRVSIVAGSAVIAALVMAGVVWFLT